MTKDGYVRYVVDRGRKLRKRAESNDRSATDPDNLDHVQMRFRPKVNLDGKIVYMIASPRVWYCYGITPLNRGYKADYLPNLSRPVPGTDAWNPEIMAAALQAYMQTANQTTTGKFEWNYRGSLDERGQPDPSLSDTEKAQIRALQRLDIMGAGVVVASHADVMHEMAREAGVVD